MWFGAIQAYKDACSLLLVWLQSKPQYCNHVSYLGEYCMCSLFLGFLHSGFLWVIFLGPNTFHSFT